MPHYTNVMLEETLLLTQRISYNANGYEEYIGYARPGAGVGDSQWVIHKLVYDSSDRMIQKLFAGGSKAFDKEWVKRATYEYI